MQEIKVYHSTRSRSVTASPSQAVLQGIAPDGGLYTLDAYSSETADYRHLLALDTLEMTAEILSSLLPDYGRGKMRSIVRDAYRDKYTSEVLTPVVPAGENGMLELFHGPTSAFKDFALSILPFLMRESSVLCGSQNEVLILTATSGDTGKAALEGFRDVKGTRIIVFYPDQGVSPIQKAQMVTQSGNNVCVCAVRGNFDDAQNGVKQIFTSDHIRQILHSRAVCLSSANSINIGRLAPQVVYYFIAYREMIKLGRIRCGDLLDYSVPTGNFGDILAGFIARQMGLPVGKLICASNANCVLTDFLRTGVYDRCRPFHLTLSPSMDILISSNLERLLYLISQDADLVKKLMDDLKNSGRYTIPAFMLEELQDVFFPAFCNDQETLHTIREVWDHYHYLCDPHTAVAWNAAEQYHKAFPAHHPTVVLATASPYKFPSAIQEALGIASVGNGYETMRNLSSLTGVPVPPNLKKLESKPVLHTDVIDKEAMSDYVLAKAVEKQWNR